MKIDIILPFVLDCTPEGKFVPCLGNSADYAAVEKLDDYIENQECHLIMEFTTDGEINLDYIREDGTYILEEEFEFSALASNNKELVQIQYEIASILGIDTIDM